MMTASLFFISTAFLLTQEAFAASGAWIGAQPYGVPSNAAQIAELGNYGPENDL
jgi:hypothetical protein